jgi:hypothetical protein
MSSANKDSLASFFLIWIPLISCSYLIALDRNSRTILNRNGEIEQPCLVHDFQGNNFSCSSFSMMVALGLSYIAFIMLRNIPSMPNLFRAFIMKGCWISSKTFSVSIERIMCFCPCFYLCSVLHSWIYVCWAIFGIPGMKLTWSWCMIFLVFCWILFANILLRIFASIFIKDIGL